MDRNDDVIARGGGSDQARWAECCCRGGDCPVCNGNDDEEQCDVCSEMKNDIKVIYMFGIETHACGTCREEVNVDKEENGEQKHV